MGAMNGAMHGMVNPMQGMPFPPNLMHPSNLNPNALPFMPPPMEEPPATIAVPQAVSVGGNHQALSLDTWASWLVFMWLRLSIYMLSVNHNTSSAYLQVHLLRHSYYLSKLPYSTFNFPDMCAFWKQVTSHSIYLAVARSTQVHAWLQSTAIVCYEGASQSEQWWYWTPVQKCMTLNSDLGIASECWLLNYWQRMQRSRLVG